tara:strand:- start:270 stop:449 length:180 start_codon:yes stop_codon:yes gene_type:complete
MSIVPYLILISLGLGTIGLGAFLWSLKSKQYEDLDGAAERVLFAEESSPLQENRNLPKR